MNRCYFKNIAESTSPEGLAFRNNYPFIPFKFCKKNCDGHNPQCEFYELKDQSEIEEETMEDSSLVIGVENV